MARHVNEPAMAEPVIVPDLIVNGLVLSPSLHIVGFLGWVLTPGEEGAEERRVVVRFTMPIEAVAKLRKDLAAISAAGH